MGGTDFLHPGVFVMRGRNFDELEWQRAGMAARRHLRVEVMIYAWMPGFFALHSTTCLAQSGCILSLRCI